MAIINKPNLHFETKLYTGTGATQSITSLDFAPDMVWIKGRSGATEHVLTDSVRGVTEELNSNDTSIEETVAQGLTAFGSDGFTVGTDGSYNTSSATYASWNWKAGGTAVSNTDGSITSSVSSNTTAGFSIVSFNQSLTGTIGHGLGVTPKMIIMKDRGDVNNWQVYHASIGATNKILLNDTSAFTSSGIWSNTAPTSSVFTSNFNAGDTIAYCFAEKKGYSKFGSYTGNGSADGTYVHLGFTPAFVVVKESSGDGNWLMKDNKRPTYNQNNQYLYANGSDSEYTNAVIGMDLLSNGFKCRGTAGDMNGSGNTIIYLAIAEQPFVTSTANGSIPATAR